MAKHAKIGDKKKRLLKTGIGWVMSLLLPDVAQSNQQCPAELNDIHDIDA